LHCAAQLLIFKTLLLLSYHLVASQLCTLVDHLLQARHVKVGYANLANHTGSLQVCQVQRSINVPGSSSSSGSSSSTQSEYHMAGSTALHAAHMHTS
jgi:hypothetical protein